MVVKSALDLRISINLSSVNYKNWLILFICSLLGIICGVLNKDKGDVIINGYDIDNDIMSIKNDLGVV